jgi:hypothetical protein
MNKQGQLDQLDRFLASLDEEDPLKVFEESITLQSAAIGIGVWSAIGLIIGGPRWAIRLAALTGGSVLGAKLGFRLMRIWWKKQSNNSI